MLRSHRWLVIWAPITFQEKNKKNKQHFESFQQVSTPRVKGISGNKLYISVPKSLPLCILQLCTVFKQILYLSWKKKTIWLGSCVLIKGFGRSVGAHSCVWPAVGVSGCYHRNGGSWYYVVTSWSHQGDCILCRDLVEKKKITSVSDSKKADFMWAVDLKKEEKKKTTL